MPENCNLEHTKEEIAAVLETIRACIHAERYTFSKIAGSQSGLQLIWDYRLDSPKQKAVLAGIELTDFCFSLGAVKPGLENETQYVFCPRKVLLNILGEKEQIDIYTSFSIAECNTGKSLIINSFHKHNKSVNYLFR